MSTRGAVSLIFNFDSYPEGLGNELLTFLKDKTIDKLKSIFSKKTVTMTYGIGKIILLTLNFLMNTDFFLIHYFVNLLILLI